MFSPILKRFVSMDPLGFSAGSMNLYETFGNDPVNNIDPFGLDEGGPWSFGAKVGVNVGFGDSYTFAIKAAAGAAYDAHFSITTNNEDYYMRGGADVGFQAYLGGFGTRVDKPMDPQMTAYATAYVALGRGEGDAMPNYTLDSFTDSPIPNTFSDSVVFGKNWDWDSAIGTTNTTGFVGGRFGDVSLAFHNDAEPFSGATMQDKARTGGGVLSLNLDNGERVDLGHEAYTGDRDYWKRDYSDNPKGIYDQSQYPYGSDLNRGDTFLRYTKNIFEFTLGISGRSWVQDFIHTKITPCSGLFDFPIARKEGHRLWGNINANIFPYIP